MDGLSAAGGVIAVLSLAKELVATVKDIKYFIQNVVDAPAELERLEDLLIQLEQILESAIQVLDVGKITGATVFSQSLHGAVFNCGKKLKNLQHLIQKFYSVGHGERKLAKIWSSLKLASKEEYIKDFECHLQQAFTILSVALTANISNVQNRDNNTILREIRTLRTEVDLLRNDFISTTRITESYTTGDNPTLTPMDRSSGFKVSRQHSTTITRYDTFLGTLCNRRTETTMSVYQDHELPRDIASKRSMSSWFIIPAFFSHYIELQYYDSYSRIPSSLRMCPVLLDEHDPIWDICSFADTATLQVYLSNNRHVSPFIVDAGGRGLLHWACQGPNMEICRVLFQLGVKPNTAVDEDGREALDYLHLYTPTVPSKRAYPELTLKLFISVFPESIEGHVLRFGDNFDITRFEGAIESFVTPDNINLIGDSPIICAWRSMMRGVPEPDVVRWVEALKKLIKLGADVHQVSYSNGLCLMHELLEFASDPCEADTLYTFWVDILFWSDVDMDRYFKIELNFYHKQKPIFIREINGEKRYITVTIDIYGDPRFSWDWWVDPHSPAHEVLEEFRNFGSRWDDVGTVIPNCTRNPADTFPFVYHLMHETEKPMDKLMLFAHETWNSQLPKYNLWKKRGERRRKKNAIKLAKAKGLYGKPSTLPGAWVK